MAIRPAKVITQSHKLPQSVQDTWRSGREALAMAFGASVPMPPVLAHYLPDAEAFMTRVLSASKRDNVSAQFGSVNGALVVELSWMQDG